MGNKNILSVHYSEDGKISIYFNDTPDVNVYSWTFGMQIQAKSMEGVYQLHEELSTLIDKYETNQEEYITKRQEYSAARSAYQTIREKLGI